MSPAVQQTSPQAAPGVQPNSQAGNRVPAGTLIPAELTKSLDAKKAKQGDPVAAHTVQDLLSNGQIVIPRDTKIVGHITEAQGHSKDQPSMLGIAFDYLVRKDGSQLPVQANIQAIGKPLQSAAAESQPMNEGAGLPNGPAGAAGGMGRPGEPTGTVGQPVQPPHGDTNAGSAAPSDASALSAGSQGVVGMEGMALAPGNSPDMGTVITGTNHNVHLDSGTQLILKAQ